MKKKSYKVGAYVMMAMITMLLSACGDAAGSVSSDGGSLANAYDETVDGVHVLLSTDKETYKAGEEVHFTLTITNDREHWTIQAKRFEYSNSGNLAPAYDGSVETDIPQLKTGDSAALTGVLVGGEYTWASAAASASGSTDASEIVTVRPYCTITYGGEEATIRAVLRFKLVEVASSVSSEDRNMPKQVTVHDPSIFRDFDGTYYVFGTHITAASSADLFDWTQQDAMFRGALSEETIAQIREWHRDKSSGEWYGYLWAPDIIYNRWMRKYCIYLSADGDDWKSNIVLLVADEVTGPYEYAGSVVYGGFTEETFGQTDAPEVLGTDEIPERYVTNGVLNKKWGDRFPNCIDPCVFYDEDRKLWMSYGSWSGGIYLLALDEGTGLRDYSVSYETDDHSDAYFGKKIAGGWYVSGEASYIQHIGDYYWLFVCYGGLSAKEGYNIRVFRSEHPDGPYEDALGNSPLYDSWVQNFNQSVGVRLFGGYKWRSMNVGNVAQGHNSAFTDEDGRSYIVYHTRTTDGTEGHHVEVHQLFLNREGWLVAAPYRTDGERLSPDGVSADDVAGDYEIILHRLGIDYANLEVNRVEDITLKEDGTISGDYEGTWDVEDGTSYIRLSMNGDTYSGVLCEMEIDGTSIQTMTFTALGEATQVTLWGSRAVE